MIGYQDPTLGKKRQQALSQYLRQQSAQRSQAAGAMRGINTSAFGAGGVGQPFLKGGSRATPDKFAFAGIKPSLKTLLGMVGRNLGQGGAIHDFNIFGPDLPVKGVPYGGALPTPPQAPPTMLTPPTSDPYSPAPPTPNSSPTGTPAPPPLNSVAAPNISYGDVQNAIGNSLPGLITGIPGMGLAGLLASLGLSATQGYQGPQPTPILDQLQGL